TATSSSIVVSGLSHSSSILFMYAGKRSFDCYLSPVEMFMLVLVPLKAVAKHFFVEVWSPLISIV
ncbi:hypothetical protein PanWU01x14_368660, partial [Parasponia andersonii]